MKHLFLIANYLLLLQLSASSQNAGELHGALKKLTVLGSVLYIAAHPDDENTRLIAYFANEKSVRTAYLSITRGDGGQNLIGNEKGPLMGVLRTNELLEARKIDGGEQFFTRAVDFGYSKSSEETFQKWEKDKILSDVVWTIRKFKPDVIITRFPATEYGGHGHHGASAMLAEEAYEKAADPEAYPGQLKYVDVWQAKRLLFNTSTWWIKDLAEKVKGSDDYIMIDVGTFNPVLGISYSELASESRTMHKSQGFGSSKRRGSRIEYLEHKYGAKAKGNIFDGIDINWNRVKEGKEIGKLLTEVFSQFDHSNPDKSIPQLAKAYKLINNISDPFWKAVKLKEIKGIIIACAGIWMEAVADDYSASSNDDVIVTASIVNRSNTKIILDGLNFNGKDTIINSNLDHNVLNQYTTVIKAPENVRTNPYWLNHSFEGVYHVDDQMLRGTPENKPAIMISFRLKYEDIEFTVERPLMYKWTDRVDGELYRPFVVLPKVTANIREKVYIFSSNEPENIDLTLKSHSNDVSGNIFLELPEGWKTEPASISFNLPNKNTEKDISFKVIPPGNVSTGEVKAIIDMNPPLIPPKGRQKSVGWKHPTPRKQAKSLVTIKYLHILTQTLLPEARSKIVKLDVKTKGTSIGYVPGPGDEVPASLEQLGYRVTMLNETFIKESDLSKFDAIITGVRAFNTRKYLKHVNYKLLEYVKNGGTYIVQYNTRHGLVTKDIGPYKMKISRDRVTVEEAPVTFLEPNHPLLNTPNKITENDFNGWVQERGLYFADEWDEKFTPILAWNDPGEDPKKGSIIVAKYGKGYFIYTGISFFRELPAGVPGAFRLFANMISIGK